MKLTAACDKKRSAVFWHLQVYGENKKPVWKLVAERRKRTRRSARKGRNTSSTSVVEGDVFDGR